MHIWCLLSVSIIFIAYTTNDIPMLVICNMCFILTVSSHFPIVSIPLLHVVMGPLGAIWELPCPVLGQLVELSANFAVLRQYGYELICFRTAFCFVNISAPNIAQKWFCIQNLRMDLSFQEKKAILNSDTWLPKNLQNKHCTIFF